MENLEKIMECVENGEYKQMTLEVWELECEIKRWEKGIKEWEKEIKELKEQIKNWMKSKDRKHYKELINVNKCRIERCEDLINSDKKLIELQKLLIEITERKER